MNSLLRSLIVVFSVCALAPTVVAQNNYPDVTSAEYTQLKAEGKLPAYIPPASQIITPWKLAAAASGPGNGGGSNITLAASDCECYTPHDSTWSSLLNAPEYNGASDDGYAGPFTLPFNFCFYGNTINTFYININGNISFGAPYTTFTANPFPTAGFTMVAPFWGDVDLGGTGNGDIWFKMDSTSLRVNWEQVGYYNEHTDKLNTFSLIITNGADNNLPGNQNVGFCYEDMQWTTGDASQGVNGFGGEPATVGANEGNGTDFIQFGRFDMPGNTFDGPFNNADGVDWLDNKSFVFNACSSTNIPPILTGLDLCDTLNLCVGDTFDFDLSILSPEQTQTTVAELDTANTTLSNLTIISNTSGTSADLEAQLVATAADVGYHTINLTAWDNGTPPDTITVDLIVYIDSFPGFPVITGDTNYCAGDSAQLFVQGVFDSYSWSNGTTGDSTTYITNPGTYDVTVTIAGCAETAVGYPVAELPDPNPVISGESFYCPGDSVVLDAGGPYDSYVWNTGDSTQTLTDTAGAFTVTVNLDVCFTTSDTFNVVKLEDGLGFISGANDYCQGDSALLFSNPYPWDSLLWTSGDTSQNIYTQADTLQLTVYLNGCSAISAPHPVVEVPIPPLDIMGDTAYCQGGNTVLDAGTGYDTYNWSNFVTSQSIFVFSPGTYTVTVSLNNCENEDQVTVVSVPAPTPTISGDTLFCMGNQTMLDAGTGYDSLLWSSGQSTQTVNVGSGTYTVTAYLAGCSGQSPAVNVTAVEALPFEIIGDTILCEGQTLQLSAVPGFDSYLWSNGQTQQTITVVDSGTFTVTAIFSTCSTTTAPHTVVYVPAQAVITGPPGVCEGEMATLVANTGDAYLWSNGQTTQAVSVVGGDFYSVSVTTGPCTAASGNFTVADWANPTPSILGAVHYCYNDSLTLTLDNFSTYDSVAWNNGFAGEDNFVGTGTYNVTVWDNHGCEGTSVDITVTNSGPAPELLSIPDFCPETNVRIGAVDTLPLYNYMWSNGATTPDVTVPEGIYALTVSDAQNCDTVVQYVLEEASNPVAEFSVEPSLYGWVDDPAQFTDLSTVAGSNVVGWHWDFADGTESTDQNPAHTFTEEGFYDVVLTALSEVGCLDTVHLNYRVVESILLINVITPNNDGSNDALFFRNLDLFPQSKVTIYNRWGKRVYENENYQNDWQGGKQQDGIYYYVLDVPGLESMTGFVHLIKEE